MSVDIFKLENGILSQGKPLVAISFERETGLPLMNKFIRVLTQSGLLVILPCAIDFV